VSDIISLANLVVTATLAVLTYFYVRLTNKLANAAHQQFSVSANPMLAVSVRKIHIGKKWAVEGYRLPRQNMNLSITIANLGTAPAINIQVDAEIILTHKFYKEQRTIPTRFEPEALPFLVADPKSSEDMDLSFGNEAILALLTDLREQQRLNLERIETSPTRESYRGSAIKIHIYYQNNLTQFFETTFEFDLGHWHSEGGWRLTERDEDIELIPIYVPRPKFAASVTDEDKLRLELGRRNLLRNLSGW
jgi:hypothetical protein